MGSFAKALVAALLVAAAAAAEGPPQRAWIEEMKRSARGPFEGIRWFCRDGAVLPPEPGACRERGGGIQHGLPSARTRALREQGYRLANVLAAEEPTAFVGPSGDPDRLAWIVLERFLVAADDGWILRGARSYRGAFQVEDEEAAGRRLLAALVADAAWLQPVRFALLREAVRWLPGGRGAGSTAEVRLGASALAERDAGFAPLRNKIHGLPEPADAASVRRHAQSAGRPELAGDYEALAAAIDAQHAGAAGARPLAGLAGRLEPGALREEIARLAADLAGAVPARERLERAAATGARLRDGLAALPGPAQRVAALEASLLLEEVAFAAASETLAAAARSSRRADLALLADLARALYGAGLLSERQHRAALERLEALHAADRPPVRAYREALRYLGRVPGWAQRGLAYHFEVAVEKLAPLEPLAHLYAQDRLRGSPLLGYSAVLDALLFDANRLAGVEHALFGEPVGGGLRPLNPGLARGVLGVLDEGAPESALRRDGIYLLPHTIAELPPVAGILTRGEGSSLSHVQLLARNLGIPNVVIDEELVPRLAARSGERVVLAVSPLGVVELARDTPRFDAVFGREAPGEDLRIEADLAKLDLGTTRVLRLGELRAADSGRLVGPKAANLAELRRRYGDAVPPGLVVPFGAFRQLLDRPLEPGGPPVFEWMRARYAELRALAGDPEREREAAAAFLARLRAWIEAADPGPDLRRQLRGHLTREFGADGSYGVFVRSDTNVEDLPGFTGAGLNLTVPNVVGFENVLAALGRVWASPFSERAYAWRQAHMPEPEYVFPGVLIQRSFPSEKSGVLVTVDVETGDPAWLSVAVNEGIGGAVEGQAAEELRVERATGRVRLLAQATAPRRAVLDPQGGLTRAPASGADTLLSADEVERLLALARELPARFPALRDETGAALPADVEFAFGGGRLVLLQIRPFVESRRARGSVYLQELGRRALARADRPVDLGAPSGVRPQVGSP